MLFLPDYNAFPYHGNYQNAIQISCAILNDDIRSSELVRPIHEVMNPACIFIALILLTRYKTDVNWCLKISNDIGCATRNRCSYRMISVLGLKTDVVVKLYM